MPARKGWGRLGAGADPGLNTNPPMTRRARAILIERRPDPADGRSSLIRLTPAAVAKIPAVPGA